MSGPVTKAFGPEKVTTYSESFLNRFGFLREDQQFLNLAFNSEAARFILFKDLNPLLSEVTDSEARHSHELVFQSLKGIEDVAGAPYAKSLEAQVEEWDAKRHATGVNYNQVVFLGLDESDNAASFNYGPYSGRPYFALSVDIVEQFAEPQLRKAVEVLLTRIEGSHGSFLNERFGTKLRKQDYGVLAEAKIILDWNNRTRYCAGCGSRNMSVHGGFKLICPPSNIPCPTRGTLTNLSFPRTDCSIIVAVVSHDGRKTLLGRSRRFPRGMYSCLAGFLEPGESIEECVRREVYEESGVLIGRVHMHSSQPWPYPANLMLGCIAEVRDASEEAHKIHLEHDKELEDAQWFSLDEARELLDPNTGSVSKDRSVVKSQDTTKYAPPRFAIAWHLIDAVANQRLWKL